MPLSNSRLINFLFFNFSSMKKRSRRLHPDCCSQQESLIQTGVCPRPVDIACASNPYKPARTPLRRKPPIRCEQCCKAHAAGVRKLLTLTRRSVGFSDGRDGILNTLHACSCTRDVAKQKPIACQHTCLEGR